MIDGLVVVDKPPGCTSHDVVARCRRIFAQRRVGHAGTLDPGATGVLLVGLGRATRLLQFLTGLPKSYEGEVVLGVATTTLDSAGEVTGTWDMTAVTLEAAQAMAAARLTGTIQQIPPMVSAIKIGGRRLHELARAGVEVPRPPRTVTVTRFELGAIGPDPQTPDPQSSQAGTGPIFSLRVDCSSGTYIRSLAADLGTALGGGAHLRRLRRSAVGPFSLSEAVLLETVGPADVIAPAGVLRGYCAVRVDDDLATDVRHGKVLDAAALGVSGPGPWPVLDTAGTLLAVYQAHGAGRAKPAVVVPAEAS